MRFFSWFFIIWCICGIAGFFFVDKQMQVLYVIAMLTLFEFVFGVFNLMAGVKRAKDDYMPFEFGSFLRKGFSKTPFSEFTGLELIGIGAFVLFFGIMTLSFLIYLAKTGPNAIL